MGDGDEDEDMDMSSDSEDATAPPPSREASATLSEELSEEPTTALSFSASGTESDILEGRPDSDAPDSVVPTADTPFAEADSPHERCGVQYRSESPLFLPSPQSSPVKTEDSAIPSDDIFILPADSPLACTTEDRSCPVRQFLTNLEPRPCGHHCTAFYDLGIRTAEDIHTLASMPDAWEIARDELKSRGVTFMEWLYIKAGLEKLQCRLGNGE